jgi:uncharacterized protein (TIGR02145 family)
MRKGLIITALCVIFFNSFSQDDSSNRVRTSKPDSIMIDSTYGFRCGMSIIDWRDEQRYGTVKIGDQCWMKENLNYGKKVNNFDQADNDIVEKTCYQNKSKNCETYGGLYTWNEMMAWENNGDQGICPPGWHIPDVKEWKKLNDFLGNALSAQLIKASNSNNPAWDGSNESGFTALPAGAGYKKIYTRKGDWALFWTSTKRNGSYAWFTQLDTYKYSQSPKYKNLTIGDYYLKENGFSVRCIKNKSKKKKR